MIATDSVIRLYPLPGEERPLKGLFLADDLQQYCRHSGRPFVYSNYVASLDGRIAVKHPTKPGMMVPKNTANERDWRLYQELAAQADLIISSGRYLRDWADGRAQEILQVDDPEFADLKEWRLQQGLSPQPDIAVISGSLHFPIPDVLTAAGRKLVVFTTAGADPERVAEIESKSCQVIVAGEKGVEGGRMMQAVSRPGLHDALQLHRAQSAPSSADRRRYGPALPDPGPSPAGRHALFKRGRRRAAGSGRGHDPGRRLLRPPRPGRSGAVIPVLRQGLNVIPFRKHVALSVDGGGIRGVIVTRALSILEEHLSRPMHEIFRLAAGTSTGAILSAGLGAGWTPGRCTGSTSRAARTSSARAGAA